MYLYPIKNITVDLNRIKNWNTNYKFHNQKNVEHFVEGVMLNGVTFKIPTQSPSNSLEIYNQIWNLKNRENISKEEIEKEINKTRYDLTFLPKEYSREKTFLCKIIWTKNDKKIKLYLIGYNKRLRGEYSKGFVIECKNYKEALIRLHSITKLSILDDNEFEEIKKKVKRYF